MTTVPHVADAVVIRARTEADLSAACAVLVEVHRTDGYPIEGVDDPTAWITGTGQIRAWVAELNDVIVGHVAIAEPRPDDAAAALWREHDPTASIAVLGRLFVLRSARGHALGRRLVHAAQAHASTQGMRLVLDVITKDEAAIALYERLGWRRLGTADHDGGQGNTVLAYCYIGPR